MSGDYVIRRTQPEDLARILGIYAHARTFMAQHGNAGQWGGGFPPQSLVEQDIAAGHSYVCMDASGAVQGVFAYFFGTADPIYAAIEGHWLNNAPYGVIHRLASAPGTHGAATACIQWVFSQCRNLRIDTHEQNLPMRNLLQKLGFTPCGIIHVEDGTPRIAYQKCG